MRQSAISIAGLMILLIISLPVCFAAELNLTYDANGNLVTGDGKYRQYNSLNQLVTIYNGTNSSGLLLETYQYHPTEERILVKKAYNATRGLKETTIYSSTSLVRTINSSGMFDTTYIHQNGQLIAQRLSDGTKQFIHNDLEGSSTIITNSTGQVVENTSYSPYGAVISGGTTTRFYYESKESDSLTGDTDFHARKYLSQYGIFTQPDSIFQNVYLPQQLNHYSFEAGNPMKNVDTTGHMLLLAQPEFVPAPSPYYFPSPYQNVFRFGPVNLPGIVDPAITVYFPSSSNLDEYGNPVINDQSPGMEIHVDETDYIDEWKNARDLFPDMDNAMYREVGDDYEVVEKGNERGEWHINRRLYDKQTVDEWKQWRDSGSDPTNKPANKPADKLKGSSGHYDRLQDKPSRKSTVTNFLTGVTVIRQMFNGGGHKDTCVKGC